MDWPKYYLTEPSNFTGGEEAEQKNLVGGVEACFWSEYIVRICVLPGLALLSERFACVTWQDATNFIPRAWPRTAAVAERGWSAKNIRDVMDAQSRLHEWRCKLITRGINAEPIGSKYIV